MMNTINAFSPVIFPADQFQLLFPSVMVVVDTIKSQKVSGFVLFTHWHK